MNRDAFVARFLPFLRPVAGMIYDEIQAIRPISGKNTNVSDAKGGGRAVDASAISPPVPPRSLAILDASDSMNPGRIRIVNGTLGNLLPDEMTVPDIVLPGGTDNHCYLTVSDGTNYIYGKVLVDGDTGLFTSADVYVTSSLEEADDTYAYLLVGVVTSDSGTLTIEQSALGSQSLVVFTSADGTILQAYWSALS